MRPVCRSAQYWLLTTPFLLCLSPHMGLVTFFAARPKPRRFRCCVICVRQCRLPDVGWRQHVSSLSQTGIVYSGPTEDRPASQPSALSASPHVVLESLKRWFQSKPRAPTHQPGARAMNSLCALGGRSTQSLSPNLARAIDRVTSRLCREAMVLDLRLDR